MMAKRERNSMVLTFEKFNSKIIINRKALGKIEIENIDRDISLIPIEIVMRDQASEAINETNFNIIVILHPPDGTHWN